VAEVAEEAAYVRYLHLDAGRSADAVAEASELLARHPDSLLAHDAYLFAGFNNGEGARLREQYRRWYEEQPDSDLRRVTFAAILGRYNLESYDRLAEVEALLDPLPTGQEDRVYALLVLLTPNLIVGNADAITTHRAALAELDPGDGPLAAWALSERIYLSGVTRPLARAIREAYLHHPYEFATAGVLWQEGVAGPALERARARALADAAVLAEDDDPVLVSAASFVYLRAGDNDTRNRLRMRLAELDPAGYWTPADVQAIWDAKEGLSTEAALAALESLEGTTPAAGRARVALEWGRASLLERAGRPEEAVDAWAAAWAAGPDLDSGYVRLAVRTYGSIAAESGHGVEEALAQVERTLAAVEGQDWGDPHEWRVIGRERWEENQSNTVAWMLQVRAELLESLGRADEALLDRQRAFRLFDDPWIEVALGHALLARGREAAAFHHLSRGLARGGGDDATLPTLEQLYPSQPV
jgi:tetratricopeptide (TPR) repeat protein